MLPSDRTVGRLELSGVRGSRSDDNNKLFRYAELKAIKEETQEYLDRIDAALDGICLEKKRRPLQRNTLAMVRRKENKRGYHDKRRISKQKNIVPAKRQGTRSVCRGIVRNKSNTSDIVHIDIKKGPSRVL